MWQGDAGIKAEALKVNMGKIAHHGDDLLAIKALVTEAGDALGISTFGQPLAIFIGDQRMMHPNRFRAIQQDLQDTVKLGLRFQVSASGDMGDALFGVIDHNAEVITGADIFAGDHFITPFIRINFLGLLAMLVIIKIFD